MRLSFIGVRRWLENNATSCSEEELHLLADIIESAIPVVERRNDEVKQKLEQIVALAKEAGLDQKAVARLVSSKIDLPPGARLPRTAVRRPYMNPFDPQSGIHAFPPNHPEKIPEWARQAISQGWEKEEMHYKKLAAAWAKRNMPQLYDPVARHSDLQAEEAAKGAYQRKKKS
ncbi:hypothetical protein OPU71_20630 [Niveibacterium sp. 24ML]|uniref:hypothetical protein n=1 Tax=Niveibacterium sp. 24ML TaxID=2985512 RepID=UPI00226D43C8|nr:hypothetical protein [Niveibacterium sp. 24ML]MCX9158536.1 hypothetical protein [Niveibacterium sp. 24ML]